MQNPYKAILDDMGAVTGRLTSLEISTKNAFDALAEEAIPSERQLYFWLLHTPRNYSMCTDIDVKYTPISS
jgi:hypothetical protein